MDEATELMLIMDPPSGILEAIVFTCSAELGIDYITFQYYFYHPEHAANIDVKTPLENVVTAFKNTSLMNISESKSYHTLNDKVSNDKPCTIEQNMNCVNLLSNLLYVLLVRNIKNLNGHIKILLDSLILEIIQ